MNYEDTRKPYFERDHYIVLSTGDTGNVSFPTYEDALAEAIRRYEKTKGGWHWIYKAIGAVRPTAGSGTPWQVSVIKEKENVS